jgi:hypothetical protein
MITILSGFGNSAASFTKLFVNSLSAIIFMGEPCPIKTAGILIFEFILWSFNHFQYKNQEIHKASITKNLDLMLGITAHAGIIFIAFITQKSSLLALMMLFTNQLKFG